MLYYHSPYEISKREGDAGYDLRCTTDIHLGPRDVAEVDTGVVLLSENNDIWYLVAPRSSWGSKGLRLMNTVGVIDPSYCGPDDKIKLVIQNISRERLEIPAGTRIAQFMIMQLISEDMERIDEHEGRQNRGGFGSTSRSGDPG